MKRVLAAVLCACLAVPAWATQGEHEVSVGVAGGAAGGAWAGLDARWLYDLTDFWALGAGVHDRWRLGALPAGRQAVSADVRFVVDALQWVPSIGGGAGVAVGHGLEPVIAPWLHVDVGVDYRPSRTWGVGVRLGAEGQTDKSGYYGWVGGVYWNWYGGKGIGLDL